MKPFLAHAKSALIAALWVSPAVFSVAGQAADSKSNSVPAVERDSFTLPSRQDRFYFYVQASIGGEGPFNLILDTGASGLVITPKVAERLRKKGVLKDSSKERVVTASGKRPKMNFAEVSDVRFGEFVVPEARAVVAEMPVPSKMLGKTVDGLAGMQLFETGTLILDYPKKKVRFERGRMPPPKRAIGLPCDYEAYVPMVRLKVAGETITIQIDSGMNGGFEIPTKDRSYPFVAPPVATGVGKALTDVREIIQVRLDTNVIWGGVTFERPIVQLTPTVGGRVGGKVLQHFVVGLDQRRLKVFLTPATKIPVVSQPIRGIGMALMPEKKGWKVMEVTPNTDAMRAGIRKGDYVTAINGASTKEWNVQGFDGLYEQGDTVEVKLRSRGTNSIQLKIETWIE